LAAVERVIRIASHIEKLHLHVCHTSTQKALAPSPKPRKRILTYLRSYAHHLLFTLEDYERLEMQL
jgi:dihydroorotase-like cyclic amidohydrolase